MLDLCFVKCKCTIVNIFARLWKSAQFCHWAIFPCSEANILVSKTVEIENLK